MRAMRFSGKIKFLEYYKEELNGFYDKSKSLESIAKDTISFLATSLSEELKESELKEIYETLKRSKILRMIQDDLSGKDETPGQPEVGSP